MSGGFRGGVRPIPRPSLGSTNRAELVRRVEPFWTSYVPGEDLDHIEVRARNLPEMLERSNERGIMPVTKTLWASATAVEELKSDPDSATTIQQHVWTESSGNRIAFRVSYISDPDGNMIALYDHPKEAWG